MKRPDEIDPSVLSICGGGMTGLGLVGLTLVTPGFKITSAITPPEGQALGRNEFDTTSTGTAYTCLEQLYFGSEVAANMCYVALDR